MSKNKKGTYKTAFYAITGKFLLIIYIIIQN